MIIYIYDIYIDINNYKLIHIILRIIFVLETIIKPSNMMQNSPAAVASIISISSISRKRKSKTSFKGYCFTNASEIIVEDLEIVTGKFTPGLYYVILP